MEEFLNSEEFKVKPSVGATEQVERRELIIEIFELLSKARNTKGSMQTVKMSNGRDVRTDKWMDMFSDSAHELAYFFANSIDARITRSSVSGSLKQYSSSRNFSKKK